MKILKILIFTSLISTVFDPPVNACTRVVYKGPAKTVITARSMDWKSETDPNIWIFPKGMQRNGKVGPLSVEWTSKYGSIIASAWDIATTDGMNEKGLVANILWLGESEYPKFDPNGNKQGIAISLWAQYVLDNFATVEETVKQLKNAPFVVVSDYIPGTERFTTLHLSISDAQGDNAVFEYIGGKLVVHHDPSYVVMTNSPVLRSNLHWTNIGKGYPAQLCFPERTGRPTALFALPIIFTQYHRQATFAQPWQAFSVLSGTVPFLLVFLPKQSRTYPLPAGVPYRIRRI